MLEPPPPLSDKHLLAAFPLLVQAGVLELIQSLNDEYAYWDKVKYVARERNLPAEAFWALVKLTRAANYISIWPKYEISFFCTHEMQRQCHELDALLSIRAKTELPSLEFKEASIWAALIDEAIASSQMEGASTTRLVAQEMLEQRRKARNQSELMIANNYLAICHIREHCKEPMTEDRLLELHRLITQGTMEDTRAEGAFRDSNEVVVQDAMTGDVVHRPPSWEEIPAFVEFLCDFFNADDRSLPFIHPIIRAISLHFMLAYMHPFVDGNGRTARALFYWYLLSRDYKVIEYLSISEIIKRRDKRTGYEKAYMYAELDGGDMGYFVRYHLRVLEFACEKLQNHVKQQMVQQRNDSRYMRLAGVNQRQAALIGRWRREPDLMLTVKEVARLFAITPTTAKADLTVLMRLGLVEEIPINQVKRGYVRGALFDAKVAALE